MTRHQTAYPFRRWLDPRSLARDCSSRRPHNMASHHQPRVVKLHRGVAPIDERRIARQPSAEEMLRAASDFPDLYHAFRPQPPSLLERIADAMDSDRALFAYLGFVAGCFVTVALAYVWAVL